MLGAKISRHSPEPDWCHLCGERKTESADVRYADNAENDDERAPRQRYVRICAGCADRIATVARE
jgi:hypothetical protein